MEESELQNLPYKIASFLLANRMSFENVHRVWADRCVHMDRTVFIVDGGRTIDGRFTGIGSTGEAILEIDGKEQSVATGSLFIR